MLIVFLYFLFLAILFVFASAMLGTLFVDAPFVPTGGREIRKILDALQIKPGHFVYDLGSGDGRVVRALSQRGMRAVGIEQSRTLVWWSRLCVEVRPPGRRRSDLPIFKPQFVHGNFHNIDLSQAGEVFCYLLPEAMAKLKEKFERELKPGARVVSRAFTIPGFIPAQVLRFGKRKMPIYIYNL